MNNKRIDKVNIFYQKYGVLTLILGRFIPFGVRNFLFMSAGMGQMSFRKFLIVDAIACLLSNSTLFFISYSLAEHYPILLFYLHKINLTVFALFVLFVVGFVGYKVVRKRRKRET